MSLKFVHTAAAANDRLIGKELPYRAGAKYHDPYDSAEILDVRGRYDRAIRMIGLNAGDFRVDEQPSCLIVHVQRQSVARILNSIAHALACDTNGQDAPRNPPKPQR